MRPPQKKCHTVFAKKISKKWPSPATATRERPQTGFPRPAQAGRVALLGNAQRQSRANYQVNSRYRNQSKTLSMNIKTTGDWLKFKRIAKNLTPSHVAMKMGIATSLVYSLESSLWQPDSQQLKSLAQILEFDVEDLETAIKKKPECAIISCDFKQTADGSAVGYCTANCNGFCWLPEWA